MTSSRSNNKARSSKKQSTKRVVSSVPSTKKFQSSHLITESFRSMDTEEEMQHFRINGESSTGGRTLEQRLQQRDATDEAFMSYSVAEKSAIRIQQNFRLKKLKRQQEHDKQHGMEPETTDSEEEDGTTIKENDVDQMHRVTVIFLGLLAIWQFAQKCISCFCNDSSAEAEIRDIIIDEGVDEGADALGVMAVQAASSAGDGAASGLTAVTIPVGGPIGGPFGAPGGGGPEVVAAQVAVAAGMAGAIAGAASVIASGGVLVPLNTTAVGFTNRCGLPNPAVREGQFSLTFKGFDRIFDARESLVVENLIVEAYNEITVGDSLEIDGVCADPIAREMQALALVDQILQSFDDEGVQFSAVETIFNATLTCDQCSAYQPLFSLEQEEEVVAEEETLEEEEELDLDSLPAFTNTSAVRLRRQRRLKNQIFETSRQLQGFDFESIEFFQRLIQLVVFKMEALSKSGELVGGFIEINKAYVIPNSEEGGEVLKMDVTYVSKGENGLFNFNYIDEETGEEMSTSVLVDPSDLNPIQTTAPSLAPPDSPNQAPQAPQAPTIGGDMPAGTPTIDGDMPAGTPTIGDDAPADTPTIGDDAPADTPTIADDVPANTPTIVDDMPAVTPIPIEENTISAAPSMEDTTASEAPSISVSLEPTISLSEQPTKEPINFSGQPTDFPSPKPSMRPSVVPSDTPSQLPSRLPSDAPSASPSNVPSGSPSRLPTESPSVQPSLSMVPSRTPSGVPSGSLVPSVSPSENPTNELSMRPSRSVMPSNLQSAGPSLSNAPTTKPSRVPSSTPSTDTPSRIPSMRPSISPSTAKPSENPSVSFQPSTNRPSVSPSTSRPSVNPSVSMTPSRRPVAPVHPNKN
ncbi:unnamed protein product [Cylindrotheca closterium]|uniref:Circumsporozoite protein n=1 Tax=Cylindrotheca closterium TaxID=2856 RepID=A0AAD2CU32_9STRA|nr:unnamed protein product [Cylindrotheca closterium]